MIHWQEVSHQTWELKIPDPHDGHLEVVHVEGTSVRLSIKLVQTHKLVTVVIPDVVHCYSLLDMSATDINEVILDIVAVPLSQLSSHEHLREQADVMTGYLDTKEDLMIRVSSATRGWIYLIVRPSSLANTRVLYG